MDQERLLSLDGLEVEASEIATVQPCGHVLPLTVAVQAATGATPVGSGTTVTSNSSTSSKKRAGEGGGARGSSPKGAAAQEEPLRHLPPGCPRCRLLLLLKQGEDGKNKSVTTTTSSRSHAAAAATSKIRNVGGGGPLRPTMTTGGIQAVVDGWATNGRHNVVTFKYKNCLYSLGIVGADDNEKEAFDRHHGAVPSSSTLSTPCATVAASMTLAQDRIRTVLGLTSLRVLCRGKVVYPNPIMSEQQISNLLLQESSSAQVQSHHKVSLLVMGTVAGHELAAREPSTKSQSADKDKDKDGSSSSSSSWWKAAIAWGGYVAQVSVSLAKTLLLGTLSALQVACNAAHHLFLTTITSNTTTNNTSSSAGTDGRSGGTESRTSTTTSRGGGAGTATGMTRRRPRPS